MKFGELMKVTNPELVISRRHDEWLKSNSNPVYTQEALDFGREQLELQAKPRIRKGTFSASSLNTCKRRQQFTFLGLPELPPSPKTAGIFQNGTFMHIRWQMAGLTAGWLQQAEVPVGENKLGLSGTQDGIAYDGTVVEFKSINTNGFSSVHNFGPKQDHIHQVGTYVTCTGAEKASIVYEDKNTQEYKEFVIKREDIPVKEITAHAQQLWEATEREILFEPLAPCEDKEGYRYTSCPFRDRCLKIRDYNHAQETAA